MFSSVSGLGTSRNSSNSLDLEHCLSWYGSRSIFEITPVCNRIGLLVFTAAFYERNRRRNVPQQRDQETADLYILGEPTVICTPVVSCAALFHVPPMVGSLSCPLSARERERTFRVI